MLRRWDLDLRYAVGGRMGQLGSSEGMGVSLRFTIFDVTRVGWENPNGLHDVTSVNERFAVCAIRLTAEQLNEPC